MAEFDHFAGFNIDKMFVMLARFFTACAPITKLQPVNNARPFRHLYLPTDGGNRNRAILLNSAPI